MSCGASEASSAGATREHAFGSDLSSCEVLEGNKVRCLVCAHHCVIPPEGTGICAVRKNVGGELKLIVYGHASCANSRDPIEKKPLYHVMPGSLTFSIATVGCNFACSFCQNWDLSQCTREMKKKLMAEGSPQLVDVEIGKMGYLLSPQEVVNRAVASGVKIMAYTYSEPTVFFEYAIDTARIAHERGLKNVFKSNGYESQHTIERMVGLIDAANIDLKSFRDEFYRKHCKARLEPVLETIRRLHALGIWTEVTTLVIPGENDSDDELRAIAQFIASVDTNMPWHVTPFHPDFEMVAGKQRTPPETLDRAYEHGKAAGLKYVYARSSGARASTVCPACSAMLIERSGFDSAPTGSFDLHNGKCKKCGFAVPGFWK
eukprot:m51a1_g14345 putative radical sam domain protein (375) ;mRNA; r:168406-170127